MNAAVDLHIHSCLSPCGGDEMTPNNIARMALLKGLDMIAVCDHNTARQLPAVASVAREIGLALLPGIELTTREEAHVLGYFPSVEVACAFSDAIYAHLPDIPNRPEFFGPQWVMDDQDEVVATEPKLLISALDLGVDELVGLIRSFGGLPIPAHINRGSNGLLNALGFLPPGLDVAGVEIAPSLPCPGDYSHMLVTHASDAHCLEDIAERTHFLELDEPSAAGFFRLCQRWRN